MNPKAVAKGREDPIFFIEEFLGMKLHKGQKKYLLKARWGVSEIAQKHNHDMIRRFYLSCANRWGKTAVISCLQLWYLFYKFGIKTATQEDWFDVEYRTANIAPYSSLTEPVFQAMKAIMSSSYPVRDPETGLISTNKCKIGAFWLEERTINNPPYKLYFANNSYIEHLSLQGGKGDNLQGKPYGLITYDEAPRSNHMEMELDNSILGRLLDWTAALHMIGTSDQDSGSLIYWSELHAKGLAGMDSSYAQEGSIYENEFMTKAQISEQEKLLEGNPLRDQMLLGKIILGTKTIFPAQDIFDAHDASLNDGVRYEDGHKYVIGVDTAIGQDEMVYTVLDVTDKPYRVVWVEACKGAERSPQMHLNVLCNLFDSYKRGSNIKMVVETFNGESARFYLDLPMYIKAVTSTYGAWQPDRVKTDNKNPMKKEMNAVQKADLIVALKKILAAKEIKLPKTDRSLTQQLQLYKEDDKRLPTDRVISLALAVCLAELNAKVEAPVFQTIEW